jgi:hypothetical protein
LAGVTKQNRLANEAIRKTLKVDDLNEPSVNIKTIGLTTLHV